MPFNRDEEQWVRDRAYFIWEREGRPEGRAFDHWVRARRESFRARRGVAEDPTPDEERILVGRHDVNIPALLTRDVPGG
ncbi:MAG TPA: DUF2934 domain-containing protein [Acetobacteraceae bacterium]|nr:DUF2934 domain-containing protein [Acetobacteraceae bacterium]